MKKILLLCICLIMCGCSKVYNLEIKNNTFYENIEFEYLNSENKIGTEVYDRVSNLSNTAIYPFKDSSNNEKYDMSIKKDSKKTKISFKYKFDNQSYLDSYFINTCFKNNSSVFNDKYYVISVGGGFTCEYNGNFIVKIKTNHKVIKNNAHKKIDNNTYVWDVKYNKDNNIYIKMDRNKILINWYLVIGLGIGLCVVLSMMTIFVRKLKNKNKV